MNILLAHLGTHYVNIGGGVERATCGFANAMLERGHQVTILYIDTVEGQPYFRLSPQVQQYNILYKNGKQILPYKLPLVCRVKREIARLFSQKKAREINALGRGTIYGARLREMINSISPDVIVSCSVISTKYIIQDAGTMIPVVQMVHDDPPTQYPSLSSVEIEAVRHSAAIQVMLPYALPTVRKYFPNNHIEVIGLPINESTHPANLKEPKRHYVISCVGTLCDRKNQKQLVQSFARIATKYPDWNVEIWGNNSNSYGRQLGEEIHNGGLEHRILIKGPTKDVGLAYACSDIFAVPSKLESFSLSLAEAMAAGLPAVGFKNCNGVNSLIQNQKTGFLVDSPEDYTQTLERLINSVELRERMGKEGQKYIKRFNPDTIWDKWEQLLRKASKHKEFKSE